MSDFRAQLQEAWTEDHGRPPTWVEEVLLDHYAESMDAEMDRLIGDVSDWQPIGILSALDASSLVPPKRVETEEDRVARELVPLVRAAADEVPMGDVANLRLDPELARLRCYMQAERKHAAELPCWCGGFLLDGLTVHLDDRVPAWSDGYFFSNDLLKGWPA